MNNKRGPLEDEFINSAVYQVASKVAEGINQAASEVTKAVNNIPGSNIPPIYPPPVNRGGRPPVPPPVQPPPVQPPPVQPPPKADYGYTYNPGQSHYSSQKNNNAKNNPNNQNSTTYHYSYTASKPKPVPPPQIPKDKKRGRVMKQVIKYGFAVIFATVFFFAANVTLGWLQLAAMAGVGLSGYLVGAIVGKVIYRKKKALPQSPHPAPQPVKAEDPKPQPVKPKKSTGNLELDKIINDGDEYIIKLRAANDAIKDEGVSSSIDRMESASKGIFGYVEDNPSKIPQIKKFMNYYLPTTLKLLNSYEKLSRQTVKGENISSTMFDIEGMMQTIATAFEKQLDSLFSSEAMDIQADITVFESILRQEGLKDEDTAQTK